MVSPELVEGSNPLMVSLSNPHMVSPELVEGSNHERVRTQPAMACASRWTPLIRRGGLA
jgi:hypothetical protein